jgi:Rap1a immunity proteins
MASLRPGLVILMALFCSTADAGPQTVPRRFQAGFYLEGCKDFLAGRSNFLSGRCVGATEILGELGSDNKLFCLPDTISNLEQVRVIVTYIEALPKRMTDGFGLLANEAMLKTWPCKT